MRFFQTRRWTATHQSAVKPAKLTHQTRVSNKNDENDKHQRVLGIMKGNAKNGRFQRRFAMQESQEATPQHEVLPEAMDGELWVILAVLGIGFIWVCFLCSLAV